MTKVKFYENVEDELLKFAVIISKTQNKYVFCKHKDRDTWEVPGGHREHEEDIIDTAKRELYEETGALEFDIKPVCIYSVTMPDHLNHGEESFGMLFFADIKCYESCGFKRVKLDNTESYRCMGEVWNCIEMEMVRDDK